MKKQIIYSLVGVALLGTSGIAFAQVAPSATPTPAPAVVPTTIPTPTTAPVPVKAPTTAPLSAKAAKQARLQEAIVKTQNSLQVRITNLEEIATRIQTRIGKMQQEGKDVTKAVELLANAQKTITGAKADLVTLEKRIATMVASKTPSAGFATVKKSATLGVVAKIKAAHKALVDTIVIMKGIGAPGATAPVAPSSTSTGI